MSHPNMSLMTANETLNTVLTMARECEKSMPPSRIWNTSESLVWEVPSNKCLVLYIKPFTSITAVTFRRQSLDQKLNPRRPGFFVWERSDSVCRFCLRLVQGGSCGAHWILSLAAVCTLCVPSLLEQRHGWFLFSWSEEFWSCNDSGLLVPQTVRSA